MEQLLSIGAEALRKAALNEDAKAYVLNNEAPIATLYETPTEYGGCHSSIGGQSSKIKKLRVFRPLRQKVLCP